MKGIIKALKYIFKKLPDEQEKSEIISLLESAADATIIILPAIVTQDSTDIYEVSANGTGSFKETRSQLLNYFKSNINLQTSYVSTPSQTLILGSGQNLLIKNNDGSSNFLFNGNPSDGNTTYGNFFVQDASGDVFNVNGTNLVITNNIDQGQNNAIGEILFYGNTVNTTGQEAFRFLPGFNNDTLSQPDSSFATFEILDANNRNLIFGLYGTDSTAGSRAIFGGTNINQTITSVSINAVNVDANAIFQIDSTTQGFLPPRMTTDQMNSIPVTSADFGLEATVIDGVPGKYYYDGASWVYLTNNDDGSDLQAAYDAGPTISLSSGNPIVISNQGGVYNFAPVFSNSMGLADNDLLIGTQFTPVTNGVVTALCWVDANLPSGTRAVGIYRTSDEALLVSVDVSKSDPLDGSGHYRTHAINPVPLVAGTSYLVVGVVLNGDYYTYYSIALMPSPYFNNTGDTYDKISSTLVYPTGHIVTSPNLIVGNCSFLYSISTSTINFNDSTQSSLFTAASTTQASIPFPPMSTSQFATIPSLSKAMMGFDNTLNQITSYDGATIQTVPWDSRVVHLTGNETIVGTKTFSSTIIGSISGNSATVTDGLYVPGSFTTGHVAVFLSTGQIQDGGTINTAATKFASDNTKSMVSSVFGATVAGNLLKAADTNGTTQDSGISVSGTIITATLTGNSTTATALQTARAINGVNFDGSAPITVTAAAGTLTGTSLNSAVVSSSLTSVGTIASGTWSGSFGAVSGANLTSLTAANISAGTAGINISGAAGTATTATNATNIATTTSSSVSSLYPVFVSSSSGGNQACDVSPNFSYIPNSGTLNILKLYLGATTQTPTISSALEIEGTTSTISGSAAFYSTADVYPLIQLLPYAHGNQGIKFDAYYDGSNDRASYTNSFQIFRSATLLGIQYSSGNTPGNTLGWSTALSFDLSGGVTVSNGNLIIATAASGYTQKSVAVSGGVANGSFNTGVTLVAGTVTISNNYVTATCVAQVTVSSSAGTPSTFGYRTVVGDGTYTITGLSTDTSTLNVAFTKGN